MMASTFTALRLRSYSWNPTGFVHAGGIYVNPKTAPRQLLIRPHEVGFDGAVFYRLALDPFTHVRLDHGIPLDLAPFRQQRIVYPLVAWLVSGGGRPDAVGWALVLMNVAGLGAIGWIGGAIAEALGRRAMWGLLLPLYPGFVVSLGLDTAEIVAATFTVGAILLLIRRRFVPATACIVAAMLTRETALLLVIGVAIAWAAERSRPTFRAERVPLYPAGIPIAIYAAWQFFLYTRWGEFPVGQGGGVDLAAPFWGLAVAVKGWPQGSGLQTAYQVILSVAMIAFAVTVLREVRRMDAPSFATYGFLVGLALALVYSEAIWQHHWGFLRAFVECYVLGCVVLLAGRKNLERLAIGAAGLWISLAVNLVVHP